MKQALTVLLVEDDRDACDMFVRLIDSLEDICLVGVTNSGAEALEYTKDYLPDVVIMDLELLWGYGNGILVLEALREASMKYLPYILVTTYNRSRITHERARHLGADFIMIKSQKDYNVVDVIGFIRSLKEDILMLRNISGEKNGISDESPNILRKRQITRIATEMDRIGISPKQQDVTI